MTDDDDNVVCLSWAVIMGNRLSWSGLVHGLFVAKTYNMNNHQFERNSQLGNNLK